MIGRTLGSYRIVEQIGMGGMATVYKAYDAGTDRYVAVKILPEHYSTDPTFRERFQREARAIAKLEHPAILPVFAYGEDAGVSYLVMRYMPTGTLTDYLRERGPLPLGEAARVLRQLASALDYAHRRGVLHRDVKPSNVLLDADGNVYLSDFGIAKMVEATADLTGSAIIGTPQYMSPEQCQGAKDLTPASDQYSLGVILYEMVTGRKPFTAETPMAVILMQLHDPLPPPGSLRPDLPEAAERAILKVLAKSPGDRYPTCTALADAFSRAVESVAVEAVAAPTLPDLPSWTPTAPARRAARLPGWLLGLLGGIVVIGGIGAVLALGWLGGRTNAPAGGPTQQPDMAGTSVALVTQSAEAQAAALPTPTAPAQTPTPITSAAEAAEAARAFAAPILAAVAGTPPDYQDDFSDPGSGWFSGPVLNGEVSYADGEYAITALCGSPGENCCVDVGPMSPLRFSDFVAEVTARFVSGGFSSWELVFRRGGCIEAHPQGVMYAIAFRPNGGYFVYQNEGATVHNRLTGANDLLATAFQQGTASNQVTVIARGPQVAFYLNGEPLWYVYHDVCTTGDIQFRVQNDTPDAPLEVRYDNLRVWDIADLAPGG